MYTCILEANNKRKLKEKKESQANSLENYEKNGVRGEPMTWY